MKKTLFGYAGTTKAIAKSGGWEIYDDKFEQESKDEFGNLLLPSAKFDPKKSELEIPSPGIGPQNPLIKKARNLISEYDYFNDTKPLKIWISGTNGKTTTTKMTGFLLENKGAQIGGNVGTPLGELDQNAKIWVLETSSFTIHYTKISAPDLYILLPITQDHLSWHGSFEEYEMAKLKPLSMMKFGSVAFIPAKYSNFSMVKRSQAKVKFYENEQDLAKIIGVNLDEIAFKTPFLMDALLALAVQKVLFDECDVEKLNKFVIEPNKLEEFSDKLGRIWVNDTKATNIDAAIQAVLRYKDAYIHLILGGDDKGVDLRELFSFLRGRNLEIYAIGRNTEKIMALSEKYGLKATKCEVLSAAVEKISANLKEGQIALLSPACASLDQFKSYAERGEVFKTLVSSALC